jgi:hypothetical protein
LLPATGTTQHKPFSSTHISKEHSMVHRRPSSLLIFFALVLVALPGWVTEASAQEGAAADKHYVVEYYYKAKWGFADEFIRLYKKNHLPILRKEMELGRIVKISAVAPRFHGTEDGRWDYRVTIVWKNVQITQDEFDADALIRQLYPDQEAFKREEQHRFEILLAHWDLPIVAVDLDR